MVTIVMSVFYNFNHLKVFNHILFCNANNSINANIVNGIKWLVVVGKTYPNWARSGASRTPRQGKKPGESETAVRENPSLKEKRKKNR